MSRRAHQGVLCAALGSAAFAFLAWRASGFFPNAEGFLGHDYEWFVPSLVAGHFWQAQNGWLTLPYFTPALCGGMPLLANPQSVFFSVPQLLLLEFEPTGAMFATLLASACVGAAGCYVLLRRYFATSIPAATLGSTLFLLNGFLFYRMVAGHLTYHAIAVVPWLGCVAAAGQTMAWTTLRHTARRLVLLVVLGGVLIAYVTYGGALNFQIPVVLTVACTVLMHQIERGFRVAPWVVLACSCAWGILISAMKLVPAVMLASQFPRPYIPDFLFRNPVDMVQTILAGFFFPAALGNGIQFEPGVGLGRHELEFGLSLVPAVLALLAVRRIRLRRLFDRPILWLVLTSLLLIPLALTFGPESWGDVLLRVPGLNNNSTFVRWWAVYLLPLLVITARCFDLTTSAATRSALLVSCILLAIGQETFNSPSYYAAQALYDPGPVTRAFRRVASGRPIPPIERVVFGPESPQQNDAFVEGASAWPCYEALFGYDLELLRDTGLVTGPITLVSPDGRLNLIDPAGYFARPNSPPATWRFEMSRLSEALKFANYRPYQWPEPGWHVAAVRVTATTVLVSAGYFALRVIGALRSLVSRWRRRTDGPTVSSSR